MLELKGVSAGYGRLNVLFDIDLTVEDGQMVGILGPNGAGKSTLLKTILGLRPARSGTVVWQGKRVTHEPAHARFAAGISLSPEGRRIFKSLSVRENLAAGSCGLARKALDAQAERCYRIFPRLEERKSQRAGSLSGGEQQMLAVSRALMSQPKLLMVDELSLGLAPLVVVELLVTLRRLCDQGLAVVVVDQFANRMLPYADGAHLLEKGRIVYSGTVAEADERLNEDYMSHEIVAAAKENA